jgi:hypothetical protein
MAIEALATWLGAPPGDDEIGEEMTERDVRSQLYERHSTGNVTVRGRRRRSAYDAIPQMGDRGRGDRLHGLEP